MPWAIGVDETMWEVKILQYFQVEDFSYPHEMLLFSSTRFILEKCFLKIETKNPHLGGTECFLFS